ncbi:adhesion G protein-coupled receptor B1-like [Branchiostoma floridae x Branchiostoma belcheri]
MGKDGYSSKDLFPLTPDTAVVHVWSTWSAYSPCSQSCGDGVRTRTRLCHHVDGSPSIECDGAAGRALQMEEISCDLDHCPVHGGWSSWEGWGACSQSCGAAVQQRVRSCSHPVPVFGGKRCPGSHLQERQCHQDPCAADGEWSDWGEYSECTLTCGRGTQQRTRTCLGQAGTGAACEGPATETRRCNEMPCPADGWWSEWGGWGQCSVSCGGGITNRTRACDNPVPSWGGRDCEGNDTEIQSCGLDPCPGEVYWSTWSDFSTCAATCGNTTHSRTRACMNGTTVVAESVCNGTAADTVDWERCTNNPCPVAGNWGAWMEWSRCTQRCGGGTRQRTRVCNNPAPEYAGQRCEGDSDGRGIQTMTEPCNERLCYGMPKCGTTRGRCGVVWKEVRAEEIQRIPCADQDGVFATRKCGRYGHWEEEDFTRCTSSAMEKIYAKLSQVDGRMMAVTDIDQELKRLLADPGCLYAGDLLKAKRALTSLIRMKPLLYADGSRARREQYIDDMLEIASLLYGRPYFDQWADIQGTVGIQEVTNITDILEELCDTVLEYMKNTREELVLARSSNIDMELEMYKTYRREPFSFPQHTEDTRVILPKSLVASAIPGRQEVPVCAFDHRSLHHLLDHLAERNNKHMTTLYHHERELNSKVVTATILPAPPPPLATKVEIHFRHRWRGQDPLCVFIDEDDPYSIYNPSGCSVAETDDYSTVCKCNHFSSYALLSKHYVETVINEAWISSLPLAGSIICLISTCLAFMSHLFLRTYLSNRCLVAEKFLVILLMASAIFVSGVNGTFLPGSHKIFIFMDTCQFKAVVLHYLFLATFSWLMVGAVQLYMDCIKAAPWWLLYHVIGWIIPLFIQAITIPWKSDVFLASNYCWVSWEQGLHWSLFIPEIVLCLITVVIISLSVYVEDQQALLEPEKYTERMHTYIWRNILQLPLFVLSWTLGLVAMETENYATQVFFGLSLIFLGLFVAVVYIIQNREIRYAYYTVIHLMYMKYRGARQAYFPKAYIDPKNPPVYIP